MGEITKLAQEIIDLSNKIEMPIASQYARAVLVAEERNNFHLAILGEFKRGKSSMVNSLIGRDLLPSDVLPSTATINVLEYSDKESCTITWTDNKKEIFELSKESLSRLAVGGDLEASKVKHVLIGLKSDILQDNLVIIDTPGVNDISKSRIEVTHEILPHCDAAIFLLDAASPVTKSEAEFLTTKILSQKITSILFVIAKIDRLDDEEIEESVEGASQRLLDILGTQAMIIPYSSFAVNNNETVYKDNLIKNINIIRQRANYEKKLRAKARLKLASDLLLSELSSIEVLCKANETQLIEYNERINNSEEIINSKFHQLVNSIEKIGRQTLLLMLEKSLDKLCENLQNDISNQLHLTDSNIERFWEKVFPLQIEKALRIYSETKGVEIHNFLNRFKVHLSKEYQQKFTLPLQVEITNFGIEMPKWKANISDIESSVVGNVIEHAFPMTVGAIIGTMFMPGVGTMVGSLAGQTIGATARSTKNDQLKQQFLTILPSTLSSVINSYGKNIENSINKWFDMMLKALEDYHYQQRSLLKDRIIKRLKPPDNHVPLPLDKIVNFKVKLEEIVKELDYNEIKEN